MEVVALIKFIVNVATKAAKVANKAKHNKEKVQHLASLLNLTAVNIKVRAHHVYLGLPRAVCLPRNARSVAAQCLRWTCCTMATRFSHQL